MPARPLLCVISLLPALPTAAGRNSTAVVVSPHGEVSLVQRHISVSQHNVPDIVAYYINTDAEEKRRLHMERQGRAATLPLNRFKAVDRARVGSGEFDAKYVRKQNLSAELLDIKRQQDHVPNATVACYVSHSELLEMLYRQLRPEQIAVVLEDDVEIPHNWQALIQKTLECAPSDWALLKVSGWGYNRVSDLQLKPGDHADITNSSSFGLMSWLQSQGGWMSRILYGAPTRKGTRWNVTHSHHLLQTAAKVYAGSPDPKSGLVDQLEEALQQEFGDSSQPDDEGCPDAYLMRRPFKETFWWHFWGPAYHYAGTGAYLVKANSIPAILSHLQKQPIGDIDGMLLSQGDLRAYELWPHIFPLTGDHMKSTMLDASGTPRAAGLLDRLSDYLPDTEGEDPTGHNFSTMPIMRSHTIAQRPRMRDTGGVSGKLSAGSP
mmetsp:Transcript_666/g.1777  ORF Transcript_666/g.1777 Transcript_666/m.1777 type:complete len:435 (-) Transcript_666:87-1391(-)